MEHVLYKFRDFASPFHLRVILLNELFFSSPSNFNDPFDCKIFPDYRLLRENDELRKDFLTKSCAENHPERSESDREILVKDKLSDESLFSDDLVKLYRKEFQIKLNEKFGVLSLGMDNPNDLRMWSSYAAAGTGFAVGFKEKELISSMKNQFGSNIAFGPVDYVDEMPTIVPGSNYRQAGLAIIKSKHRQTWHHENEFRVVRLHGANQTYTFSAETVKHVIVGPSTKPEDEALILEICKCRLPDVPVLKVIPRLYEYEMDLEQLA